MQVVADGDGVQVMMRLWKVVKVFIFQISFIYGNTDLGTIRACSPHSSSDITETL